MAGNGASAVQVARRYFFGREDETQDRDASWKWWKVAAEAGSVEGVAIHGDFLMMNGTALEKTQGFGMLCEAAARGCRYACLTAGHYYAQGNLVAKSHVNAVRLLQEGLQGQKDDFIIQPREDFVKRSEKTFAIVSQGAV